MLSPGPLYYTVNKKCDFTFQSRTFLKLKYFENTSPKSSVLPEILTSPCIINTTFSFLNARFNNGSNYSVSECSDRLSRRFVAFTLRVNILGYGNGAFKSVAQQIVLLSSRTDLCNYNTLDIEGNKDAIFSDLRNLLVKYLQDNPEDYNGMSHVFFFARDESVCTKWQLQWPGW